MNLSKCLKRMGLSKQDSTVIRALVMKEGSKTGSSIDSAKSAINKRLVELRAEKESINKQIKEYGSKKLEVVAKEEVAQPVKKEVAPVEKVVEKQVTDIEKAAKILDDAGITGKERRESLKDIKSGDITVDELAKIHPPKDVPRETKSEEVPKNLTASTLEKIKEKTTDLAQKARLQSRIDAINNASKPERQVKQKPEQIEVSGDKVFAQAGTSPTSASPITLKKNADGTLTPWHEGNPLMDYETGKDIVLKKNVSAEDIRSVVKSALGPRTKLYKENQGVFFSKSGDSKLTAIAKLIASHDEAFQQPKAVGKTVESIGKEIDPKYKVDKLPDSLARTKDADKAWEIHVPDSPYRSGYLLERRGKVWIDVSRLVEGIDSGNKIYGIAADYAHNTGKVLIGDPNGLSHTAFFRRTENMISSALKYGTTDHLAPHEAQINPKEYYAHKDFEDAKNLRAIDWEAGNMPHNLREMMYTSYKFVYDRVPEIKDIVYDFDKRQFTYEPRGDHANNEWMVKELGELAHSGSDRGVREDGSASTERVATLHAGDEVNTNVFRWLAVSPGARASHAGITTLKRAALTNTMVRGKSQEEWRGLMDEVGRQLSRDGIDQSLKEIFYQEQNNKYSSPLDKPLIKQIESGAPSKDVLQTIASKSTDSSYRELAERLKETGVDPTVKFGKPDDYKLIGASETENIHAAFDSKSNEVIIFNQNGIEQKILHEFVHAATYKAIKNGGANAIRMESLFNHAKKNKELFGEYGISNIHEFLPEAFSNNDFKAKLASIDVPGGSKFKNVWEWFVDIVRNIVGLPPKSIDMLSEVMRGGARLMKENTGGRDVGTLFSKESRASNIAGELKKVKESEVIKDVSIAMDGLQRAIAPQYRSDIAREVSRQIISGLGEKEMSGIKFRADLNKAIVENDKSLTVSQKARDLIEKGLTVAADRVFLRKSKEENQAFMQAMDTGDKKYFADHSELKGMSDVIGKMFLDRAKEVQALDTGALQTIRDNYFPRIWNREPSGNAQKEIFSSLAKRPFEGQKGFTKARVFEDINAGIKHGFELISDNPLDIVMLKMEEIDKFILAHKTLQAMEGTDGVRLIGAAEKSPEGYTDINGRYGFIDRNGEKLRYVGRDDVAQVINNYLSPSLYHNKYVGKPFTAYMGAANMLNRFQLGVFSAFHAGFTSMEAIISHASIGVKSLSHGDIKGAVKYLGEAPLAWVNNPRMGSKIIQEMLDHGSHPEMAKILEGLQLAGFKWQMDERFRPDSTKKMLAAWEEGSKVKAGFHSINAIVEQSARPILEWLVPRQKFGVFGEMYSKWMHDNPNATHEELRNSAQQIWNRVDSRLGQVVYDRLFMHNVTKNIGQMLIRAPGWTGGTILEVGGGIKDLARYAKDLASGKKPEGISDRAAYTLSMLTVTAVANSILTALFTGKPPDDWKDLIAFKTGNLDERGKPERFMLPTYMKDVYAYANAPGTTLLHKSHPLLSLVGDLGKNRNYYGDEIRNPDDSLLKQLQQTAGYTASAFVPFWMKGVQKESDRGGTNLAKAAPLIGVMPAPASVSNSSFDQYISDKYSQAFHVTKTPEGAEQAQKRREAIQAIKKGEAPDLTDFSVAQISRIYHDARTPIQIQQFGRLSLQEKISAYNKASDAEREQFHLSAFIAKDLLHHGLTLPPEERQKALDIIRGKSS